MLLEIPEDLNSPIRIWDSQLGFVKLEDGVELILPGDLIISQRIDPAVKLLEAIAGLVIGVLLTTLAIGIL